MGQFHHPPTGGGPFLSGGFERGYRKLFLSPTILPSETLSLDVGDAGSEYTFFNLPTNCKAHAKEPYSPATIYFKIDGKTSTTHPGLTSHLQSKYRPTAWPSARTLSRFHLTNQFYRQRYRFVDGTAAYEFYYSFDQRWPLSTGTRNAGCSLCTRAYRILQVKPLMACSAPFLARQGKTEYRAPHIG